MAKKKHQVAVAKVRSDAPAETVLFSEDDLWVRVEGDRGQVGISDLCQARIGEVIGIELPDVGDAIERGEPFGQLESVRTRFDLIAPVSGSVVAINGDLEDNPALANEDPYHDGWLIEVEIADETELDDLIGTEEYEERHSKERH